MKQTAVIIGAGPAGLTAAYELLTKTGIVPIVLEADSQVGGLSKTINYKGNRIDIGGHRFFSKSARVIKWWLHFLPIDASIQQHHINIQYQQNQAAFDIDDSEEGQGDGIMLVRPRKSRIYFEHKFFDYPLRLNAKTIRNLGIKKMMRITASYMRAKIWKLKPEETLEQFFINRFGLELYETFFKDYTEKVWGVPCKDIPATWGQQRVKDLNVSKVLWHAIKSVFVRNNDLAQKGTSTSLIEQFLYPKFGPGQMWETVAGEIERLGGKILLNTSAEKITGDGHRITHVHSRNKGTGQTEIFAADYVFSTMPVKELFEKMQGIAIAPRVLQLARNLQYRDFMVVGILVSKLSVKNETGDAPVTDNWIYIQDKQVKAGRLQIFNNWSPAMVANAGDVWIGVEYFLNETDLLWQQDDATIAGNAVKEMESIGILDAALVKDTMVARIKKAYPSYYGSYDQFNEIREQADAIENLFLVGRNGMHRYNNSDHSMLTAMTAVENIISGRKDKSNIWSINTEDNYHEEVNEARK